MNEPTLTKLDNEIYYYENLIDNPEALLEDINSSDVSLLDSDMFDKWVPWTSSNDDWVFGSRKLMYPEKYNSSSELIKDTYEKIKGAISLASNDYSEHTGRHLGTQEPRTIAKYDTGSFMGPHTDAGPMAYISGVLYLNDDYQGGELEFPNQQVEIKPSAGSMIIFPSVEPYVHNPKTVTAGDKYMVPVFWFKD